MDIFTVLVVDDDAALREVIGDLLEDDSYVVVGAENGREALDFLRSGLRPNLILLDLLMPIMNGWQFLEERDKDDVLKEIPVVLMSASRGASPGPEGYAVIRKPMTLDTLLEAVRREALTMEPMS